MTDGFDPDAALDEIRKLTRGFGTRLAYLVLELDEHLKHGRELPRAWRVPPHDYMIHSHPHTGSAHGGIEHDHEHRHLEADPLTPRFREQVTDFMDQNDELLRRLADS